MGKKKKKKNNSFGAACHDVLSNTSQGCPSKVHRSVYLRRGAGEVLAENTTRKPV